MICSSYLLVDDAGAGIEIAAAPTVDDVDRMCAGSDFSLSLVVAA